MLPPMVHTYNPRVAETTAAVTNMEVGTLIDMGYTGISRLRSGDRNPSIAAMLRIERAFGWSLVDQVHARERGEFGKAFEQTLINRYGTISEPKNRKSA